MPTRAVLFDLGGTLVFQARRPDREQFYAHLAAQVRPLLDSWRAPVRIDLPVLLAELFAAVEAAQPERRARGLEVDTPFITRGALAAYGIDVAPEQAAAFWAATATDPEAWGWQAYPDTLDVLRRLRSLSVPTAIVSNGWYTSEVQRGRLASLGIGEGLIDAMVCSADLMRVKPRPEPFLRALEALGVDAGAAVFIGDDLEADVRGAKALGMTTVWKLNGRHDAPPAPEADYTIHHLWELLTLGLLPEARPAALAQESLTPHEDGNADRY